MDWVKVWNTPKWVRKTFLTLHPQPEVLGEDSGLPERFPGGQTAEVADEAVDLLIDGIILMVGRDDLLTMAPQMIHRVQVWRALGQPQQFDLIVVGQGPRVLRRVAGVLVEQQGDMPPTVVLMDLVHEGLTIGTPVVA